MSPRKTRNAATVSEEDVRLFEQAVGKVRRMIDPGVLPARPQPPPEPVQSRLDEARVPAELMRSLIDPAEIEVGEELSYLKPGLSPRLLRRLKRGHFSIADEIDLHQMTTEVARGAIKMFLNECQRAGRLCVRIIHGKGLRSKNKEPVLKRKVAVWLTHRDEVLAFCQARATEGGGGAAVVLLSAK